MIVGIGDGGAVEAGGLLDETADAIVDGHDLTFDVDDSNDAILNIELVAFDVAPAWLDDLELVKYPSAL